MLGGVEHKIALDLRARAAPTDHSMKCKTCLLLAVSAAIAASSEALCKCKRVL